MDFKDLGSSDLYPQSVRHNSNGRFVVVSGDGEYVVYTAMALRNKCFGSALEFVWSANDGNEYAIRENNSQVSRMCGGDEYAIRENNSQMSQFFSRVGLTCTFAPAI